jgi:hypothetical protein
MTLHVYRYRANSPARDIDLQRKAAASATVVDRAGGQIFDIQVDDANSNALANLDELMSTYGYSRIADDPVGTPVSQIRTSDGTILSLDAVADGQVLRRSGTTIVGAAAGGDVVGPASATDNAIARFDGTTGKLLQSSVPTVSDAGDLDLVSRDALNIRLPSLVLQNLGNISGAVTLTVGNGVLLRATLVGNVTFSITNPAGPCRWSIILIQDATGTRTATLPTGVFARNGGQPALSPQASSRTVWSFIFDGTSHHVASTDLLQPI